MTFFFSLIWNPGTQGVLSKWIQHIFVFEHSSKRDCEGMILFAVFTVVAIYFIEEEENYVIFERKRGDFIYSLINGRMSMDN